MLQNNDVRQMSAGSPSLKPTNKQLARINKIINSSDRAPQIVKDYMYKKFRVEEIEKLNRKQAQKVITGLDYLIPRKPILGVWVCDDWIN